MFLAQMICFGVTGPTGYIFSDAKQLASEFVAEGATANKAFHARSILSQVKSIFSPSFEMTISLSGGGN